jgi:hypothetical protein
MLELRAVARAVRRPRPRQFSALRRPVAVATFAICALSAGILHSATARAWPSRPDRTGVSQESVMRTQGVGRAIAVVSSLALSTTVFAQGAVQWRVADGGNGHWYRAVHQSGISWDNARSAAMTLGGDLVTLTSAAENAFVVAKFRDSQPARPWIGLQQSIGGSEPSGGWGWVSGEAVTWTNWGPSEPGDDGGIDADEANIWLIEALELNRPVGTWNDWVPGGPDGYIVEWSADCNNDGLVDYGQVLAGDLIDCDGNNVPDSCEAGAEQCTIQVPRDFPTIQAAIDSVPAGTADPATVISVAAGTYFESFALNGKSVVVRGAPKFATVIDGTNAPESIVRFTGGEPATAGIQSLVLRNGDEGTRPSPKAEITLGGALYGYSSDAFVRGCRFESCSADFGAGAYMWNCGIDFKDCEFLANDAVNDGGGLFAFRCVGTVDNCHFDDNTCGLASTGSGSSFKSVGGRTAGAQVLLSNCSMQDGLAFVSGSAIEHYADIEGVPGVLRISGCTVSMNASGASSPTGAGGLRVLGPQSSCVLANGTSICGNLARNVGGPYLVDGAASVCDCEADFVGDGVVNAADLGVILNSWGIAGPQGFGDLDHNGLVNAADLSLLLSNWGPCD